MLKKTYLEIKVIWVSADNIVEAFLNLRKDLIMLELTYGNLKIIKEYSNSNRTLVIAIGTLEGKIFVAEFNFTMDELHGNKLKRFEDYDKQIHFQGKESKSNLSMAKEAFDDVVDYYKSVA